MGMNAGVTAPPSGDRRHHRHYHRGSGHDPESLYNSAL